MVIVVLYVKFILVWLIVVFWYMICKIIFFRWWLIVRYKKVILFGIKMVICIILVWLMGVIIFIVKWWVVV